MNDTEKVVKLNFQIQEEISDMKNILDGINNKKINDLNIMEWSNTNYLKYMREKNIEKYKQVK